MLVLIAFFLIFMALRILYPPTSLSRPTSTLRPPTSTTTHTPAVTNTFTVTPTITRTPRPTWTLHPSSTFTNTPTPLPTDTALPPIMPTWVKPIPFNDFYQLRDWSPEDATRVIELLQAYPDALYPNPVDRETATYNAAYTFVIHALKEALLRFPNDQRTELWRWDLAYNLAHTNDADVSEAYTALIQEALDKRLIPLDNMPDWFNQHEPNLKLLIHKLTPAPGYLTRQLIEITAVGGSTYIWMVESPLKVELFPVTSHFDYANPFQMQFSIGDLTGDGVEEVVIYANPPQGRTTPELPQIFSLVVGEPHQLSFAPEQPFDLGTNFQIEWVIDQGKLRSSTTIYPACPVQVNRLYYWDGVQFTSNYTDYQIKPVLHQLGYCEGVVDHVASQLGAKVAIPMIEVLTPEWPPMTDPDGKPYPADARDALRYRLGVYNALAGNFERSIDILTAFIAGPTTTDSRWIIPAQQFLDTYASPDDLYKACLPAKFCDPKQALQQLITAGTFNDISTALDALIRGGVIIRSSGDFDFDNDGEAERWILLRHHTQEQLEFWILVRWENGVKAVFIEQVDSTQIRPYFHEPLDSPPIAQIGPQHGFVLSRLPITREPYLKRMEIEFIPTTFTLDSLQSIINDLFMGTSPATIRDRLVNLEQADQFNCLNYRICDLFYYTLGLAYELEGDIRPAVDTYVKLWWENSHSPFMLVARLKLKQLPYKSLTPSTSPTLPSSPTHTPVTNATPSITPTLIPNPTETSTQTETLTPTP